MINTFQPSVYMPRQGLSAEIPDAKKSRLIQESWMTDTPEAYPATFDLGGHFIISTSGRYGVSAASRGMMPEGLLAWERPRFDRLSDHIVQNIFTKPQEVWNSRSLLQAPGALEYSAYTNFSTVSQMMPLPEVQLLLDGEQVIENDHEPYPSYYDATRALGVNFGGVVNNGWFGGESKDYGHGNLWYFHEDEMLVNMVRAGNSFIRDMWDLSDISEEAQASGIRLFLIAKRAFRGEKVDLGLGRHFVLSSGEGAASYSEHSTGEDACEKPLVIFSHATAGTEPDPSVYLYKDENHFKNKGWVCEIGTRSYVTVQGLTSNQTALLTDNSDPSSAALLNVVASSNPELMAIG